MVRAQGKTHRWILAVLATLAAILFAAGPSFAAGAPLPQSGDDENEPGSGASPDDFTWEFWNWETSQLTSELPIGQQVEIILASATLDVRDELPIRIEVRVNGELVHEAVAGDKAQQCRDATGCSIPMPGDRLQTDRLGPGDTVEITAYSQQTGDELSTCTYDHTGQPLPEPSASATASASASAVDDTTNVSTVQGGSTLINWWCAVIAALAVVLLGVSAYLWWRAIMRRRSRG